MFYLLLIIYLGVFFFVILTWGFFNKRNYLHRSLGYISPCPFGKREILPATEEGERESEGIFSYSLFGNYEKYSINLLISLDIIKREYPSWQPWVYVGSDINPSLKKKLLDKGAKVITMSDISMGYEGSLWRFIPLNQEKPFLSLDADDVIPNSTFRQIKPWLNSGKKFFSINPVQFLLPYAAGCWGSRDKQVPNIIEILNSYCEYWFGFDETFLREKIAPLGDCYVGDTFYSGSLIAVGVVILAFLMIYSLYLSLI